MDFQISWYGGHTHTSPNPGIIYQLCGMMWHVCTTTHPPQEQTLSGYLTCARQSFDYNMKIARLGKRGALSGWKKSVLLHITAIKRAFFCQVCSPTIPSPGKFNIKWNLWKLYRSNLWKLKITSHHLIIFPVERTLPSLWWHSGHWEPPHMSRLLQPLVRRMRCRHCWARMADHPTFAQLGCLYQIC